VTTWTARRLAWSVGIVSIALMVAALVLFLIDRAQGTLPESVGPWTLLGAIDIAVNIPVPILGVLIASRRPENRIGWLYLGASLVLGIVAFGQVYSAHVLLADPGFLPGGGSWPG
jgi:hypothetical protein